jgi:hypothetical protein
MSTFEIVVIVLAMVCVVGIALTIRDGRKQVEREKSKGKK